jgi:hypothetical protein
MSGDRRRRWRYQGRGVRGTVAQPVSRHPSRRQPSGALAHHQAIENMDDIGKEHAGRLEPARAHQPPDIRSPASGADSGMCARVSGSIQRIYTPFMRQRTGATDGEES